MGKLRCLIVTNEVRNIAAALGINPGRAANYIAIWQSRNDSASMPSLDEVKDVIESTKEDRRLEASLLSYAGAGKMVSLVNTAKRPGVQAENTLEAIKSGERTATTRYEKIDYWKQFKEGDILKFTDASGEGVFVRVTKPLTKLSKDTNPEEWSKKEGWSVEYFNQYIKPKIDTAWQLEYEYVADVNNRKAKIAIYSGNWTRDYVEKQTDSVFLFGDNTEDRLNTHYVPSSTQAVIRGLPNAIGIDTKKNRGVSESSYFTDADYDQFKAQVDEAIQQAIDSGKTIVLPADGIGTGKAQLEKRAPKLFEYLQTKLSELTEQLTEKSAAPKGTSAAVSISAEELGEIQEPIREKEDRPEYTPEEVTYDPAIPDITKDAIVESATKLNSLFTPQQLSNRISNVAKMFSDKVDALFQRKQDELRAKIENMPKTALERVQVAFELKQITDQKDGKTAFIKEYLNINEVIAEVREQLINDYNKELKGNHPNREYRLDQYDKMLNSLDLLLVQALSEIEGHTGIRIVISQKKNANNKKETTGQQYAQDPAEDEEDENYVSGNSGWTFKQREADPHNSLTQNVRRILRKIPMLGENSRDDLGKQRYLDAEYVYATILNGCSWMIDSDDFHKVEKDENGEIVLDEDGEPIFRLPAIDALAKKYPWMETVQNFLYADPSLVPEFYTCFRLDYIPYYIMSMGKFAPVNKEMSVLNAIDSIIKNYETGNTLTKDSIFDFSGNISKENAQKGVELVDKLSKDINNEDFTEESYETLRTILNMLGVETDVELDEFLSLSTGNQDTDKMNYQSISKILANARNIFANIEELKPGTHLINYFNNEYTKIAKIVGSVTRFNRHMTFRQGEKDYPSYSTPNFATTTIKKLLSPEQNRRDEIIGFYKQASWFFNQNSQTWNNFMLDQFENNDALVEELRDGCLVNMNTIRVEKQSRFDSMFAETEAIPYEKWTPAMIKQAFIKAYFSAGVSASSQQQYGYYNFPIFADATCAMFMKFLRFTDNYQEQILPLLRNVVIQELGRKKLVNIRKGKAAKIANFDDTGDNFFFFTELNTYQSKVSASLIDKYYNAQYEEAVRNNDNALAKAITDKLNALPRTNRDGETFALFEDVVKAHKWNKDLQGVNNTIDSAITDIMNKQFRDFMSNNVQTNIPLIESLVEDGIIPRSELEAAVEKLEEGKNFDSALTISAKELEKQKKGEEKKKEENAQYATLEEALREYYWNNSLMQSQIIELMNIDPAFFKFDGGIDFQKRFHAVYSSGRKLDTSAKYGREFEKAFYLSDRITVSRNYNQIKQVFDYAVKQGHMTQKQEESILAKFEEINNADAQAFRCLSSVRSVLSMSSMWTDAMEECYNSIKKGEWDPQNMSVIWQTIKPFMYAIVEKPDGNGGTMLVPHINKNSEFLILAAYQTVSAATAKNTKLSALSKFMEAHHLDVVMYESAVKSGTQNTIDINISIAKVNEIEQNTWDKIEEAAKNSLGDKYKAGRNKNNFYEGTKALLKNGTISQDEYNRLQEAVEPSEEEILKVLEEACYDENGNENPETIHKMPYSNYMISQPTPEHWIDNKVVDGSQKRNLIVSDISDEAKFVIDGQVKTGAELKKLYDEIEVENLIEDFEEVKREVLNIENLQESLLQQIKGNPKYPRDFINFLSIGKFDGKKRDFAVPIDFPSVRNKIAELILAKFKNKITKQKAKGGTCILVADTENILGTVLEDGSYLNMKDKKAVEYAKKHNLIRGFECYLPAWTKPIFENYIKTVTKDGKTWQELDFKRIEKESPELLEMCGIRIPTEDKYSITPLIVRGFLPAQSGSAIMLPADITTIVGLDFDVDKMFIRLYNFTVSINEEGKVTLRKIEYDYSKNPKDNTREQRENALLDIELAIMRNKETAEALFNPGNFDPIKEEAMRGQILTEKASNGSSLLNLWQEAEDIDYNDIDKTIKSINEASLSKLKKFVDRFAEKRSLLSLDSFIYNHQQNMAGAALIGRYANNTTAQAKTQTTRLAIKDGYTFKINGKTIKSLHDVYAEKNGIKERISKRCSYFSAASVDNVKFPCLRKIGQTPNTAYVAEFMTRAGMDVKEIMLFFKQPLVDFYINTFGDLPNAKVIKKNLKYLNEKYGTELTIEAIASGVRAHNFTDKELTENIIKYNRTLGMEKREIDLIPKEQRTELVFNLVSALVLFNMIQKCADDLRGSVQISRADSPNGAIKNELHLANRQVQKVDEYMANASNPDFSIEYITDIMSNGVVSAADSKDQLREKLLSDNVRMKRLQAFHSLGIEVALQLIAKYFISQSPEAQAIFNRIKAEAAYRVTEDKLKILYNDIITYILSGSKTFGDDEKQTFEEKRSYYLFQFPKKFADTLAQNPELAATDALANLRVVDGEIVMERSGKITSTLRDSITRSFDSLLFDKKWSEIAYGLYMYSFYNEGFIFRHNSYGQFFSAAFLTAASSEALNTLRKKPDARTLNNFFEQWVAQKDNRHLFAQVDKKQTEKVGDNTIRVNLDSVPINDSYLLPQEQQDHPYNYIVCEDKLYLFDKADANGAYYHLVPEITDGPTEGRLHKFNASKSAAEMAKSNDDENRVKNLKLLNAASYRQQAASERAEANSVEGRLAALEASLPDEESFATEIDAIPDFESGFESLMNSIDALETSIEGEGFADALDEYDEELGQQTLINKGEDPLCFPV